MGYWRSILALRVGFAGGLTGFQKRIKGAIIVQVGMQVVPPDLWIPEDALYLGIVASPLLSSGHLPARHLDKFFL